MLLTAASVLVATALAGFSARRAILIAAAVAPRRRAARAPGEPRPVTLVVPARNEEARIDGLLEALDRLDYPSGSLSVVLVNDGSEDRTGERLVRWAADRPRAHVLELPEPAGKAAALNAGLAAAPVAELVAVCDADLRPRPDWLRRLAPALADESVAAAAAFLAPCNADASAVARYAAVETWTHQLVTSAGKDRLRLNPPMLGASMYRRAALGSIGGFRAGAPGEDAHATVALTRAGWRTRFVREAVVDNAVVDDLRDYWYQHIRWARNVLSAGHGGLRVSGRAPGGRPSPLLRVEVWAASAGYADRLALVAAAALAAAGALPAWLPLGYLAVAASEAVAAIAKAGAARRLPGLALAVASLFPIDVVASAAANMAHLSRRPRTWRAHRRARRAGVGY